MAKHTRLITHPDNLSILRALKHPESGLPASAWIDGLMVCTNTLMERRRIREVWHPPASERFVEYGPEDEAWARPLGLGRVERVDDGPLFYLVKDPPWLMEFFADPFGAMPFPKRVLLSDVKF